MTGQLYWKGIKLAIQCFLWRNLQMSMTTCLSFLPSGSIFFIRGSSSLCCTWSPQVQGLSGSASAEQKLSPEGPAEGMVSGLDPLGRAGYQGHLPDPFRLQSVSLCSPLSCMASHLLHHHVRMGLGLEHFLTSQSVPGSSPIPASGSACTSLFC